MKLKHKTCYWYIFISIVVISWSASAQITSHSPSQVPDDDTTRLNLDYELINTLESINTRDQELRQSVNDIGNKYGWNSKEMQLHWNKIKIQDSLNLAVIQNIIDNRGWLGADIIGKKGTSTLFLVIQHSDISTQEKYLPIMRNAVIDGKMLAGNLALTEDRVLLRKGERQLYGTQIGTNRDGTRYIAPISDPENVNERRKRIGLSSIEEYISNWNLKWNAKEHEKDSKNRVIAY